MLCWVEAIAGTIEGKAKKPLILNHSTRRWHSTNNEYKLGEQKCRREMWNGKFIDEMEDSAEALV